MADVCPTCGAGLKQDQCNWDMQTRTFIGGGIAVRFPRMRAKVMDALWRTRHKGGVNTRDHLMQMVYGDDPEGGPICSTTMTQTLSEMRVKLKPTGYTITKNTDSPNNVGYRLAPITTSKQGA